MTGALIAGVFEPLLAWVPFFLYFVLMLGLGLGLLVLGLLGIRHFSWPEWRAAIFRLEVKNKLLHHPLTGIFDQPSGLSDNNTASAYIWQAYLARINQSLTQLKIGWLDSDLARLDPMGLRAVAGILFIVFYVMCAGQHGANMADALRPLDIISGQYTHPRSDKIKTMPRSFKAWVQPPEYTRKAPIYLPLNMATTTLPIIYKVPQNSHLILHFGAADLAEIDVIDKQFQGQVIDASSIKIKLQSTGPVRFEYGGNLLAEWSFDVVADKPPLIKLMRQPHMTRRDALAFDYAASDDYAIEDLRAIIQPALFKDGVFQRDINDDQDAGLDVPLYLPKTDGNVVSASSYHDLNAHPMAGRMVEILLQARDHLGQIGKSTPVYMILPEKTFTHPVAQHLAKLRKDLLKTKLMHVDEILAGLDHLRAEPSAFEGDVTVYLGLRILSHRLQNATKAKATDLLVNLMWKLALRLEDGGQSLASKLMRSAQNALRQALDQNASLGELENLLSQLEDAMDNFLDRLDAANAEEDYGTASLAPKDGTVLTRAEIKAALQHIRDLFQAGMKEEALALLNELQAMLEMMDSPKLAHDSPEAQKAKAMLRGLQQLSGEQRRLLDQMFQQNQNQSIFKKRRWPSQGKNQTSLGADIEQKTLSPEMAQQYDTQQRIKDQLEELRREISTITGDTSRPASRSMSKAEDAMDKAMGAIRQGDGEGSYGAGENAVGHLDEAVAQLQQSFANQFPSTQGFGQNGSPVGRAGGGRDPFGRLSGDGGSDLNGKLLGKTRLKTIRKTRDELRRRAGERYRPQSELRYIERLLDAF